MNAASSFEMLVPVCQTVVTPSCEMSVGNSGFGHRIEENIKWRQFRAESID
jgi:hypothetical protein